jgi:hypothetical protein
LRKLAHIHDARYVRRGHALPVEQRQRANSAQVAQAE